MLSSACHRRKSPKSLPRARCLHTPLRPPPAVEQRMANAHEINTHTMLAAQSLAPKHTRSATRGAPVHTASGCLMACGLAVHLLWRPANSTDGPDRSMQAEVPSRDGRSKHEGLTSRSHRRGRAAAISAAAPYNCPFGVAHNRGSPRSWERTRPARCGRGTAGPRALGGGAAGGLASAAATAGGLAARRGCSACSCLQLFTGTARTKLWRSQTRATGPPGRAQCKSKCQ